ncbi:hypothetical protein LGQ02_10645 [Bacillus shivajii]|uniref:hypothetical protein n=1 Tax=Bacillus shivajii TaxID=1983719 RepID=UPI001CF9AEC6|nr:hypothetical protein [Bacillus shivajii]UCZ55142.1 hypothetical protein LGQ02_10645 [Bacillus shivajii]
MFIFNLMFIITSVQILLTLYVKRSLGKHFSTNWIPGIFFFIGIGYIIISLFTERWFSLVTLISGAVFSVSAIVVFASKIIYEVVFNKNKNNEKANQDYGT